MTPPHNLHSFCIFTSVKTDMSAHRALVAAFAAALAVAAVRGGDVEIKERPTRTEHGRAMRQMVGGIDPAGDRHSHLWDDDDGILFPRQFKPFHTWSFDEWLDNEKKNTRNHDRDAAETHKLFDAFHAKHEKWYQEAMEAGSLAAMGGALLGSSLGNIIVLVVLAFACFGIYACVNECRRNCEPLSANHAKQRSGGSAFRRGEVRSAKVD